MPSQWYNALDIHALINVIQRDRPGLLNDGPVDATPLTGGVSCEIFLLDDGEHRFVLKRALEKLKVKADWYADIGRNRTEQQYLRYVAGFLPDAVPRVLHSDDAKGFFCMEMVEGGFQNWKQALLAGNYQMGFAQQAGRILGAIHARSHNDVALAWKFATHANFYALRLEPYLITTAMRHPQLQKYFDAAVQRIAASRSCLIHGDFSPKNLLVSDDRFVVLDCEVAYFGDPVFDLAFLLNHFFLKALRRPADALEILALASAVWVCYRQAAGPVVEADFEQRMTGLLPLLMLARVDGKSPVEYLCNSQQALIRKFVTELLPSAPKSLSGLIAIWTKTLEEESCCENS